jgi:hypothetical protein
MGEGFAALRLKTILKKILKNQYERRIKCLLKLSTYPQEQCILHLFAPDQFSMHAGGQFSMRPNNNNLCNKDNVNSMFVKYLFDDFVMLL